MKNDYEKFLNHGKLNSNNMFLAVKIRLYSDGIIAYLESLGYVKENQIDDQMLNAIMVYISPMSGPRTYRILEYYDRVEAFDCGEDLRLFLTLIQMRNNTYQYNMVRFPSGIVSEPLPLAIGNVDPHLYEFLTLAETLEYCKQNESKWYYSCLLDSRNCKQKDVAFINKMLENIGYTTQIGQRDALETNSCYFPYISRDSNYTRLHYTACPPTQISRYSDIGQVVGGRKVYTDIESFLVHCKMYYIYHNKIEL